MHTRSTTAFISLVLCLAFSTRASIDQFIDDRTVIAGEIDFSSVDPGALEAFLLEAGRNLMAREPGSPEAKEQHLKAELAGTLRFVNDFKALGGTKLYLVSTWALMPQSGPVLIAPVADEQAKAMAALLESGSADGPATRPGARGANVQRGEAIPGLGAVRGTEAAIAYVRAIQPKERPDLKAALAAAGAAPLRIAIAIDPATRDAMAQKTPPQILGKPSTLLTRDLKWASVSATFPPAPGARLVLQSTDAAVAQQTRELIVAALGQLRERPVGLKPEQTGLLTPVVQNDQLVLELKEDRLQELAMALSGPLLEARQQARQVQSMTNIKNLLLACHMHAADHEGRWPDELAALEKYIGGGEPAEQVMTNPARPDVKPAYVYLKPANPSARTADTAVVYESHTDFGRGVAVGFVDGHVEFINDRQRFDQLLADSATAPTE